jgi:hypothetical protein
LDLIDLDNPVRLWLLDILEHLLDLLILDNLECLGHLSVLSVRFRHLMVPVDLLILEVLVFLLVLGILEHLRDPFVLAVPVHPLIQFVLDNPVRLLVLFYLFHRHHYLQVLDTLEYLSVPDNLEYLAHRLVPLVPLIPDNLYLPVPDNPAYLVLPLVLFHYPQDL